LERRYAIHKICATEEHFDGIQDAKSPTYVDLAKHIVNLKAEHF
jgi:hypothetical protein